MAHFLVQWKFSPDAIAALRASPHDRLAMSTRLAEAFQGSIVSYYNRTGEYDGLGIFLFPDLIHATAHTVHAMATGAFELHHCEPLLTSTEYRDALALSQQAVTTYQAPNKRFGLQPAT